MIHRFFYWVFRSDPEPPWSLVLGLAVIFLVFLPYSYFKKIQCFLKYKGELQADVCLTYIAYYNKAGQQHCSDGPAVIYFCGDREYCFNGKLHNPHGPAVILGHRLNWFYTIRDLKVNRGSRIITNWEDLCVHRTYDKVLIKEFYVLDDVIIGQDLHLYGENSVLHYQLLG